jgi:hypothetical protein
MGMVTVLSLSGPDFSFPPLAPSTQLRDHDGRRREMTTETTARSYSPKKRRRQKDGFCASLSSVAPVPLSCSSEVV